MAREIFGKLGPIYAAIGEEAAAIVGGDPDGAYLYTEAGDGRAGCSAYGMKVLPSVTSIQCHRSMI